MGLYEQTTAKRRRRRRRNPAGPIIVVLLLIAALALGGTLMLRSCQPEEIPETQPAPETEAPVEEMTEPVSTVPVTEAPTEETTEETTEATTEPTEETTEATTEPTTEPTEETTEATTEATTEPTKAPTDDEKAKGKAIATLAKEQIGKPYALGGDGPDDFDTSGFVKYCVKEVTGVSPPHSVSKQAKKGERIEKKDLLPGDVVFFWTTDPESVEYVGVYIGSGKFVAARNEEKPVSELSLKSEYFTERYLFACRYW